MTSPSERPVSIRLKLTATAPRHKAQLMAGEDGLTYRHPAAQNAPSVEVLQDVVDWIETAGLEVVTMQQRGRQVRITAAGGWPPDR